MADKSSISSSSQTKTLIKTNYDKIAQKYTSWSTNHSSPRLTYLKHALSLLPSSNTNNQILELGCGAGTPVLETILQHPSISAVHANDISTSQLNLARKSCPTAKFHEGDMLSLDFPLSTFDAVVAFYSMFHLPRNEQVEMLRKVWKWLKSGTGVLVLNFGTEDEEEMRSQDFFGEEMFWSGFGVEGSKEMMRETGFEILRSEVIGSSEEVEPGELDYGVKFLWVLARKRSEGGG